MFEFVVRNMCNFNVHCADTLIKTIFYPQVTDNLIQQVKDLDIEVMAAEIFDDDPTTQVENLKVTI